MVKLLIGKKLPLSSSELFNMEEELYGEVALAFSEIYSSNELESDSFMRGEVRYFLGLEGRQAEVIIRAAREFRQLFIGRKPEWVDHVKLQ